MKIKTTFLLLFLSLFLSVVGASNAFATSYYLWDDWGGTYYDAEKSSVNTEDDLMCWAAAASNVLSWTGWGNVIGDADDIFAYFQEHWTDEGGDAYYGYDWWFDGTNNSEGWSDWSQVDVDGGGFFTGYNFLDYYLESFSTYYAMGNIEYLLYNGYGTTLALSSYTESIGHMITCWGIEYDTDGSFLGIWVTDSDDDKDTEGAADALRFYNVLYDEGTYSWFLQDFYGRDTVYISLVEGLLYMPAPEPATMLLFGVGLLGLAGMTRRKLKK